MALPATGIWEIQTTGNDNNGGLFDPSVASPGTDYTYGAGQTTIAYTDLVIGATTTQLTSAARAFVAADVGNTIQITAGTGFTVGFYNIRSVAGGTATMDRSVGTTGSTGGTGTLGGALASPGKCAGALVAGNLIWHKSGTYTITNTVANTANGPVNIGVNSIRWGAYLTTRGDDAGTATLQASGVNTFTIFQTTTSSGKQYTIRNLVFDGNSQTAMTGFTGWTGSTGSTLYRCKAMNCTTVGFILNSDGTHAIRCEAVSCNIGFTLSGGKALFCVSRSNSTRGFSTQVSGSVCVNCLAISNTGVGFYASGSGNTLHIGCIAYNNGGGGFSSVHATAGASDSIYLNCVAYLNTGWGISITTTVNVTYGTHINTCAFGSNTSGAITGPSEDQQFSTITLTANPYDTALIAAISDVPSAFTAFLPNNVSGGGALVRGAGLTPYADVGAAQHQEVSSGGGPPARIMQTHGGVIPVY